MRRSLRWISSSLCRVARLTVVPSKKTGSNSATGVTAPVRPTCRVMSFKRVSALWAGNL